MWVLNPEGKLSEAVAQFGSAPAASGERIAHLGREVGYHFIQSTLWAMEQVHTSGKAADVLTLLRQPEWVWYETEDPNVKVFGVPVLGNEWEVRGIYRMGRQETGAVEIGGPDMPLPTREAADPRDVYKPRRVRTLVYKINGLYNVVAAGRVVDLVKAGFNNIRHTHGKGYLGKRAAAFAVTTDSTGKPNRFRDPDLARECRARM